MQGPITNVLSAIGLNEKKGNESGTGSSKASSSDIEQQYEKSEEYKNKAEVMMLSRNRNARKWIIMVMTYYIVRATFIIFPWWEYNTQMQKNVIICQLIFMAILSSAIG